MRRASSVLAAAVLFASLVTAAKAIPPQLRAGVARAELTWHAGATGGQVANDIREGVDDLDPFLHESIKQPTQGFHDRLWARALVLEDPASGDRFAYVNTDLYLQQNLLHHYVAELLRADALAAGRQPIPREHVMISATHNHSAPYFTTPSWGVWLFVDKYDERHLRYTAHQIAAAVEEAEGNLRPVRFGAAVTCFDFAQRNIIGPQSANDGTPAGYPKNYYDADLTVLRFDEKVGSDWKPYALWSNLGMHPESLGGGGPTGLLSADFPIYAETFAERQLRDAYPGSNPTVLLSQGSVGDVEPDDGAANHNGDACRSLGSGNTAYGASHDFWRENFRAIETYTAPLAAQIVSTAGAVETGTGVSYPWPDTTDPSSGAGRWVPFSEDAPVRMVDYWFAGPLDHPLPTYCNQEVAHWFEGSKPKDCELIGAVTGPLPNLPNDPATAGALRGALGPEGNMFIPSTGTVQETTGIHLQALAIGDVLVGTCPCEPGSDQTKNFKVRTDTIAGNFWQGYEYPAGWNANGQSWPAGKRDAVIDQIQNQFTKTELSAADGFKISMIVGQANDYIGYIVTERQWLARDQYRKELTAFGPKTSDYVNSGLLLLAAEIRHPGAILAQLLTGHDRLPVADRAAMDARDDALITEAEVAWQAWDRAAPPEMAVGTAVSQPGPTARLGVARFTWNGGTNWSDSPQVVVERETSPGTWTAFESQEIGDVVTSIDLPDPDEVPTIAVRPWPWTAHWETRLGTPAGTYRFHVNGTARIAAGLVSPYDITSSAFTLNSFTYAITGIVRSAGIVTFRVEVPQLVPHGGLVYYNDALSAGGHPPCYRCTFRVRPLVAPLTSALVNGSPATQNPDGSWSAADPGGLLQIDVSDANGNQGSATTG